VSRQSWSAGSYANQNIVAQQPGGALSNEIVVVLTMDMIGWDSDSSPRMELHTRTSGSPGYASDLALAALFTNVVASYGLSAQVTPLILADGVDYSDHWSFWDHGFSAILAIEDDADFTPYYHTASDALTTINFAYFTALTKAMAGTLAHLAGPAGRSGVDVVQLSMYGRQAARWASALLWPGIRRRPPKPRQTDLIKRGPIQPLFPRVSASLPRPTPRRWPLMYVPPIASAYFPEV
jgi:hypothetical protein